MSLSGKRLVRTALAAVLLGFFFALPTVAKAASNDADLSALSTPAGALSPSFAASTQGYLVSPASHLASTTVTAVTADPGATMTVTPFGEQATALTSGIPSSPIPLTRGDNGILITVTASDAVTVKTYNIDVGDPPSTDASLSSLSVSNGSLNVPFVSDLTSYSVATSSSSEVVTAVPNDSGASATISVDGATPEALSGPFGPISLGGFDTLAITVTAQDDVTQSTYDVVVVATPTTQLQSSAGGIASPGGTTIASTTGIRATLNQAAGPSSGALFVARYSGNPTAATTGGTVSFFDVRVSGTTAGSRATVTFNAPAGVGALTLEYFNPATDSFQAVAGSSLLSNSLVVDTANNTITIIFDSTSTPALASLRGTVFAAVETPIPTTGVASRGATLGGPGALLIIAGLPLLLLALPRNTKREHSALGQRRR